MSVANYIDIDSSYRNQILWPLTSHFEVPFDHSGAKNAADAIDPISSAAPIIAINDSLRADADSAIISGTITSVGAGSVGSSSAGAIIYGTFTESPMRTEDDFYNGLVLANTAIATGRRIIKFQTVNAVDAKITLESAFPDSMAAGDAIIITSPTDATTATSNVFIPTGKDIDNYYVGWNLDYDNNASSVSWTIASYSGVTRIATLDSDIVTVSAGADIIIRETPIRISGTPTIVSSGDTTVTLDASASNVDNIYIGAYITLTETVRAVVAGLLPSNTRRITAYNGGTQTATVTPAFDQNFASIPTYGILPFTRDNVVPLSFSGGIVAHQVMTYYKVKLLNIIIPNLCITTSHGGNLSTYPYIYVEFQNVSGSGAGLRDVIYSNNPNAKRMFFKAAMKDVNHPVSSSFIKLDGCGMTQTIRFKPVDTFVFSIRTPDGLVIQFTDSDDTSAPQAPDPMKQVSATFSVERLN